MNNYSKLLKQSILFVLVGLGSLIIDIIVTTFLFEVIHFPAYLAGIAGFLSAFFFNFPINRKHVFHHSSQDRFSLKMQVVLYISLSLFNIMVTGVFMQLMMGWNLFPIGLAKIFTTGTISIWNFLIFRFLIFSKK